MNAQPIIIDITEPPPNTAQEIVDLLVGSFGLVGVLAIAAIVVGLALAAFLYWRRSRSDNPLA